ncbi:MAG: hypothetical protein AAF560_26180 [Acidobacteriota bacterium]
MPSFAHALALVFWLLGALPAAGHIGSPDVFYDGQAGPWSIRVIVRAPEEIPGLSEITVRVHEPGAEVVRVRPVRWDLDLTSAPAAKVAQAVRGGNSLWNAELWFSTPGSYSVYVEVEGAAGTGTAIVPFHPTVTQKLELRPLPRAPLIALGLLLLAGFVRLVWAGVRTILEPGAEIRLNLVRNSLGLMVVALALISIILHGGEKWWDGVDMASLGDPWSSFSMSAALRSAAGPRVLDLHLEEEGFQRAPALVPDHGKPMRCS